MVEALEKKYPKGQGGQGITGGQGDPHVIRSVGAVCRLVCV